MTKENEIKELIQLFAIWITEIRINNYISFYDINKISEGFVCDFLNLLYDYNLSDLNAEEKNMCAIDLGDKKGEIAFQVTSRTDGAKIKDTLEKFKKYKLDEKYSNGIKFLILSNESVKLGRTNYGKIYDKFDKKKDIITEKEIIEEIKKIYDTRYLAFQNILTLFKHNFSFQSIETNVSDDEILEKMSQCLDRPAFITPFYIENNFGDFRKAIDDTIEAINTGVYRLRDGTLIEKIYPKSMIKNIDIRCKIDEIVLELMKLRTTYDRLKKKGDIEPCRCGNSECSVSIWSRNACAEMDNARRKILCKFKKIYPKFSVKFIEIGEWGES